jgi:hypothetical protein
MAREQRLDYLLPAPEAGAFQAAERIGQVEKTAIRRQFEHAQRTGDGEAFVACDCRALALVDQEQISFKGSGQFDGCALSIVELIESSIGAPQATTLRISTQPGARIYPVAHWLISELRPN